MSTSNQIKVTRILSTGVRAEGSGRKGMGAHRNRLPWVSMNHLHGIMRLEELDPALYQQLCRGK